MHYATVVEKKSTTNKVKNVKPYILNNNKGGIHVIQKADM